MVWVNWILFTLYAFFPFYFLLLCKWSIRKREKNANYLHMGLRKNELFCSLGIEFLICTTLVVFSIFLVVIYVVYVTCLVELGESIYAILESNYEFLIVLINIIVTLAVALIVYNKKMYIVFSLKDYLDEYDFGYYFVMMIICGVGSYIVTIQKIEGVLNAQCVLGITIELLCIYYIIKCFRVEYIVLFGSGNTELNILKKLYRIYNISNVRYSINNAEMELDEEAIEINLEFLFQNFIFCYRRAKGNNITDIEYVHFNCTNREKWIEEAKREYLLLSRFMCFLSLLVFISANGIKRILILPILFIVFELLYLGKSSKVENLILKIWEGNTGFSVTGKKRYYFDFWYNSFKEARYLRLIQSITSLAAFAEIILTEEDVNKNFVDVLEERLIKIEEKNIKVGKEVLPYFLIGYLLYKKKYKMKPLKRLYKNEKEVNFDKMLLAFMECIDRGNVNDRQKNYMNWLAGNYEQEKKEAVKSNKVILR